jgi:hypothetical protein
MDQKIIVAAIIPVNNTVIIMINGSPTMVAFTTVLYSVDEIRNNNPRYHITPPHFFGWIYYSLEFQARDNPRATIDGWMDCSCHSKICKQ